MSNERLVLHQYQVSPFAAKVRRAFYYKGIDFEVQNYGLAAVGRIKKFSPSGKLPVLAHAGQWIVDSTDIIHHIEDHYPDNPILPLEPRLRAQAHILEDWADESLYFYDLTMRCWPNNIDMLTEDLLLADKGLAKRFFRPLIGKAIGKQAHSQGIGRKDRDKVCAEIEQHFDAIVALLSDSEFLVGDALSVADLAVVSMCTVLERAEEADQLMRARPTLMLWRDRVDAASLPAGTAQQQKALV